MSNIVRNSKAINGIDVRNSTKVIRYSVAVAALAGMLGAVSQASATSVYVDTGGAYQPGTINISGPDISLSALSTALELTANVGGSPNIKTLYTFCVDIYHDINVGVDYNNNIVAGAGDAQIGVNQAYNTALLTVNSDGPTSGVSGAALSATQIAEIGGLANIGGNLIATDSPDLSNKLAGLQGAIWSIEYPSVDGYAIAATDSTVQGYLDGYVANAFATKSDAPVVAIYGANGQGLLPAGAVPEPASWALMLTGFGLAGAQLRRRKTVGAATA
jgi:hypothetical protein